MTCLFPSSQNIHSSYFSSETMRHQSHLMIRPTPSIQSHFTAKVRINTFLQTSSSPLTLCGTGVRYKVSQMSWRRKFPGQALRAGGIPAPDRPRWRLTLSAPMAAQFEGKTLSFAVGNRARLDSCCQNPLLQSYIPWQAVGVDWTWLAAGLFKLSPGHWCLELLSEQPCSRWVLGLLTTWHRKQGKDFGSDLCGAQPNTTAQWGCILWVLSCFQTRGTSL